MRLYNACGRVHGVFTLSHIENEWGAESGWKQQ